MPLDALLPDAVISVITHENWMASLESNEHLRPLKGVCAQTAFSCGIWR
jgi:hypothetical protein